MPNFVRRFIILISAIKYLIRFTIKIILLVIDILYSITLFVFTLFFNPNNVISHTNNFGCLKGAYMKKMTSIILLGILVATAFVVMNPVSASTHGVYAGKDALVNGNNLINVIHNAQTGDTVRVHAGTYQVTKTITIPYDKIKIVGDDPFTTIIDASGNSGSCITSQKNNTTIRNLTIRNSSGDAINLANDSEVSNCIIKDNKGHAIYGNLNIKVKYAYIENNGLDGIEINNNGAVENVISKGNNGNNIRVGSYSNVKNCLSTDSKSNDGIYAGSNSMIINCTSSNNYANGIKVGGHSTVINSITTGNSLSGIDGPSTSSAKYCNSWKNKKDYSGLARNEKCISKDPMFVSKNYTWKGWIENKNIGYFLSTNSPCINSGSGLSKDFNLSNGWSTVQNESCDSDTIDMGFHFASKCRI